MQTEKNIILHEARGWKLFKSFRFELLFRFGQIALKKVSLFTGYNFKKKTIIFPLKS